MTDKEFHSVLFLFLIGKVYSFYHVFIFYLDPAASVYTCEFCRSTYSHPGNFKQHLGKHERESGCVSAAFNSGYLGPSSTADEAIIQQNRTQNRARPPQLALMRGPSVPTSLTASTAISGQANNNAHLSNALR
jgi:hypothetical protein